MKIITKWDQSEAQFWFARYAFESDNADDREQATEVFGDSDKCR